MTGFEPQTSGIGSDRSTNWTTAIAQAKSFLKGKKYPFKVHKTPH